MKVALVHTPYYHQKYMENLKFVSNNFGVFPPIGLMYVSSILKNSGHKTKIIDVKAENLSRENLINQLKEFKPGVVGVMLIPHTARITLDWAKYIKRKLKVPIIAGNYGMIHYPEAILSNNFIDYGIVGSARIALPKLLEFLESGKDNFQDIKGLAFKKDEKIIINFPDSVIEDMDKLPWPDRDAINNSLYCSMASKERPFTILTTSYGCIHKCDFCDMGKFGYSERDPSNVVDEIEECVKKYGIKEIDIFDRDFLINKERTKKICEGIIERGLILKWSCRTRVDKVDEKILKLMKKSGCRLILYGIESGVQEILDREHKGITLEETKKAIKFTKKNKIETLGFFIIGHPGETEAQIRKTIEFSKELPLDYAQFFRMLGKTGSKLYDDVKKEMGYDYFDKFIRGEVEEKDIPRPWTELSNEEINKWVFKGYREFYLRPKYIFKVLLKLKSFSELKRYVKVGFKISKMKIFSS